MRKSTICLCLLVLLTAACQRSATVPPPDAKAVLRAAAQAVEAISVSANEAAKTILLAEPENTETRRQILGIIGKIVEADSRAKAIIVELDKATLVTPADVVRATRPIYQQIREAIDTGLLGIKNPDSRRTAQVYLLSIGAALNSLQAIMEIYGQQ